MMVFIPLQNCNHAHSYDEEIESKIVNLDFDMIKERGVLRAITTYSSTSYFMYRGVTMGYEYELLNRLADYLGLELEIIIAEDLSRVFEMLNNGEGDIIAMNLTITNDRAEKVAFTEHHVTTRQVLVQRKPDGWQNMSRYNLASHLIQDPVELMGKTVYVWGNSAYETRLKNLSNEIGGNINIESVPGSFDTEELMRMVSDGVIDYTVADENIARINSAYYDNLDVSTPVSFTQRVAWAVRHTSPELLQYINNWLEEMKTTRDYFVIYNRYYENRTAYKRRVGSDFYSLTGNRISVFDDLLISYADKIGWDWRLLASLIYQESGFNPYATSWAGAAGLMQLMPATADFVSVSDPYNPVESIRGGTRYLHWLDTYWKQFIENEDERLKFVLGSYNVGYGHVMDARRLADKYGKNPDIWEDHVDVYLKKKSQERYFNDEVVRHGYCRGNEPYHYVRDILSRYREYAKFIHPSENKSKSLTVQVSEK